MRLLFGLLGGPLAWAIHLLASYGLVAIACLNGWTEARLALGIVTVVALAVAIGAGIVAARTAARAPLLDAVTGGAAARFTLGLGTRLSALFGFLILLGGLVPFMAPLCPVTQ